MILFDIIIHQRVHELLYICQDALSRSFGPCKFFNLCVTFSKKFNIAMSFLHTPISYQYSLWNYMFPIRGKRANNLYIQLHLNDCVMGSQDHHRGW